MKIIIKEWPLHISLSSMIHFIFTYFFHSLLFLFLLLLSSFINNLIQLYLSLRELLFYLWICTNRFSDPWMFSDFFNCKSLRRLKSNHSTKNIFEFITKISNRPSPRMSIPKNPEILLFN